MPAEIPTTTPEKKEMADDNARKFIVSTAIDPEFLREHSAEQFLLTTDWLEMSETSEKKLAHKHYPNGDIKILLIQKFRSGDKTSVPPKEKLSPEQYQELLPHSIERVAKTRYEFDYPLPDLEQSDPVFTIKYDEFVDSELRILEVDAATDDARSSFTPTDFPYELTEVTGQMQYYGYRVADVV